MRTLCEYSLAGLDSFVVLGEVLTGVGGAVDFSVTCSGFSNITPLELDTLSLLVPRLLAVAPLELDKHLPLEFTSSPLELKGSVEGSVDDDGEVDSVGFCGGSNTLTNSLRTFDVRSSWCGSRLADGLLTVSRR